MAISSKFAARLTSPFALLLAAAALAAGVAAIAYFYLQQREEAIRIELSAKTRKPVTPSVEVVVPMANVEADTVLNGSHFVSRSVDADLVYPDALLVKDFPSMQGVRLARPVLRGRPVRLSDLQPPEVRDVAAILPLGKRAMTIDIDKLNSIAQTLRPHNHVDIFLLSKAPKPVGAAMDDKALEQASLFMQDMVVLATGKEFQDLSAPPQQAADSSKPGAAEGSRDSGFDSITLLVNPKEAAKLMVGQKMGTFRVVLRGKSDRDPLDLKPLRAGDLMPAMAKARDADIEFIVGGRGDNLVSTLAVPPSQLLAMRAGLAALAPRDSARTASSLAEPSAAGEPAPSSAANQPIPAFRQNR